jgi:hypothetical protein
MIAARSRGSVNVLGPAREAFIARDGEAGGFSRWVRTWNSMSAQRRSSWVDVIGERRRPPVRFASGAISFSAKENQAFG